jgi:hypothetical protein
MACRSRPVWRASAPQQPWPLGTTTSQPSSVSTLAVAAETCEKKADCTHPVSSPTTARGDPTHRARRQPLATATRRRSSGRARHRAQVGGSAGTGRAYGNASSGRSAPQPPLVRNRRYRPVSPARTAAAYLPRPSPRRNDLVMGTPDGHAGTQARQPRQASR